jgi:hypothetical protein
MGVAGAEVAVRDGEHRAHRGRLAEPRGRHGASRKALAVIRQNIWSSIAIKTVFLLLAVGGWETLWMVAAGMRASVVVEAKRDSSHAHLSLYASQGCLAPVLDDHFAAPVFFGTFRRSKTSAILVEAPSVFLQDCAQKPDVEFYSTSSWLTARERV